MADLTLRDLLPPKFQNLDPVMGGELGRSADLRKAGYPKSLNEIVARQAADKLAGVLNADPFELLACAWAKASELHDYSTAAGKHSPTETATLFLGEHELAAELHPLLQLAFGAIYRTSFRFTLELAADIKAVQLVIRDGRIIEIGECQGSASAQLKYDGFPLHEPFRSRSLTLIHGHSLPAPGFSIP